HLITNHIDILCANVAELVSLYETGTFDDALPHVRADCDVAALTRSEKGSVIVAGDEIHVVDAEPVDKVVDTTGAGDQYAAGFLYGLTHGMDFADAGRVAGIAATEVITHVGPRPLVKLAEII
ncbi:MAG: PfkB family carbohydrate kinase, partial [Alphaproteobacteria bacterium]|nr:PfkB family carbohydrate kinase [Alphaproteobacteria bacterium]